MQSAKSGLCRFAVVGLVVALTSCGSEEDGSQYAGSGIAVSVETPTPAITSSPVPSASPVQGQSAVTDIDVLLVLGQSNATGYQFDRSNSYAQDPFILAWDGAVLAPYAPNVFTGIEAFQRTGFWAAEVSYALHYRAANPTRKLLILRYTAAGTQLANSGDLKTDWNVRSSGELYDGARAFVRTAFAAVRMQGYSPQIRLVWWQQGETDTYSVDSASQYLNNLTDFVAALRDQSGDFAVPTTAPIVIGRLSSGFSGPPDGKKAIRDAQASVAHADLGGSQILLDDDDLPLETDSVHLNKAAQLNLGERLWSITQGTYEEPDRP